MDRYLQQALEAIERHTAGLSPERIARPVPGKWSVAEILDHLRLAFTINTRALDRAVATGEPKARRPSPGQWLARTCVIDVGYFPKARAPETTRPDGAVPPERAVDATREALVALDAALARAATRFGTETPILNHPYFAGLSVHQWRRFHWRHAVHHMKQVHDRAKD